MLGSSVQKTSQIPEKKILVVKCKLANAHSLKDFIKVDFLCVQHLKAT